MLKICSICNKEYQNTLEFFNKEKRNNNNLSAECKDCRKEMIKIWSKTEKGIASIKKSREKYNKTQKAKDRTHKYHQTDKYKSAYKKYEQSDKGRENIKKCNAKRKQKGFIKFIENPFSDKEKIDYHHFMGAYVIALPKDLHQLYSGKNHKDNLMYIVNQIYY